MTRLAVDRLTLSHFRSHKHAKVETDHRPIAIFGPNGAGKTNILEALSLLSPGRGLRRAKVDEMARAPENLGWKVSAQIDSLGHMHEVETAYAGEGGRTVRIDDKAAPQIALSKIFRLVWLVPVMDRLWVEGAEGRRRFLDRLSMSFEPKHGERALAYEKAMRERNRMLKDGILDPAWYSAVERQMAETGALIEQVRLSTIDRIMAAQRTAETSFPAAELTLEGRDAGAIFQDANDLTEALADSRPRDLAAGRSLVGPHRDDLAAIYADKQTAAKLCSTGEQKALLVSLVLANGRALTQDFGAAPIMLLDEVAAHLDAARRAALYDEICALGAQAWMTGTGAELFEDFGDRAQRLEVTEEDGLSVVKEPTE